MKTFTAEGRLRATSLSEKQHNCDYRADMDIEGDIITTTHLLENNVEEELAIVHGDSGLKAIVIINKSSVSCKIKVSNSAPASTEIVLPPGFPYFYYGLQLTVNGVTEYISTIKALFEALPALEEEGSGSGSSSSSAAEYENGIIETIAVY